MRAIARYAAVVFISGTVSASPLLAAQPSAVTFNRDVAPLVFANCSTCHRPGGSASFSLLTYADVKRRAQAIATATLTRYMPPWKPEAGAGEFVDVRRLTDAQIDVFQQWLAQGTVEGDPAQLPPLPSWSSEWSLGKPDLVLTMDRPYSLRAGGEDMYRHFVIPIPIPANRYIKAWEFRPGNPRVVHHATMEIDRSGASRGLDERDPEPGYEGLIAHSAAAPDGYFLDWAPGHTPYVAPAGMAIPLQPASDLVLMLHLRPSGKPESVQASIALYFTDAAPTRVPALLRLTRQDLDIPRGEKSFVVTSSYVLPVAVDLITVQPHAHYLARQVESSATLPDGSTKRLLSITDWDFNWQGVYRYVTPVPLPAGTSVSMRWTYDNSADNPFNPGRPPKRVRYGQRTSDEMSELWFQVVPGSQKDRDIFTRDLRSRLILEEIKGYETMLREDASNVAMHDDVALLYAATGNRARAAAHFRESALLRPESAAAQYNLATALFSLGRSDEARRGFEKAVALDPAYANAHRGLAALLQSEGRVDEAEREYRLALALAPEDAVAHHNLGVLMHSRNRLADAMNEYRMAIRLNRDYADAHYGLALAFKALSRTSDAISEYREALRSRPDWAAVQRELDALLAK
jgi:Tfp pilus assembly protein PilF/mono/diheme cytochrome c family protein